MISIIKKNMNDFLIISLFINPYLNLMLLSIGYLGEQRRVIVILMSFAFLLFNLLYVISIFLYIKSLRKIIVLNCIAFLLTIVPFILNTSFNLNLFVGHIVYVFPILVFVCSLYFVDSDNNFENKILFVLIPVIPILIYYSFRGFFIDQSELNLLNLDNISYMVIGNFMALLLVIVNFTNVTIISSKYSEWIKYLLTFLLIFGVIVSGSKGAILSIITYSVFVLLLNRKNRDSKKFILVFQILLAFFVSFTFLSDSLGSQRLQSFIVQSFTKVANIISELVSDDTNLDPDIIVIPDPDIVEIPDPDEIEVISGPEIRAEILNFLFNRGDFSRSLEILDQETRYKSEVNMIRNDSFSARLYLYRLSIMEIQNNPLQGVGYFGFYNKYGTYPHNFVLEILVDNGLIIGVAYLLLILVSIKKLYDKIFVNHKSLLIFSLVVSYFPIMLFSNTVYLNNFLYLLLFYTLNSVIFCKLKGDIR